jgi:outer membrane lipase/esterase
MTPKLLALLLMAFSAPAFAGPSTHHRPPTVFVFGDSLSDNGNFTSLHPEVFGEALPPPYQPQRFSNGPIWVDYLSRTLDTPILPEVAGGTNYAVAGATVSPDHPFQTLPDVTGLAQVERFLEDHGTADPDAIYIVWIGGNDIDAPAEFTEGIYTRLVDMIGRLHAGGARTFLVPNQQDIGKLPAVIFFAGPEYAAMLSEMTRLFNERLEGLAANFPDARIRVSDVYGLKAFIDAHPGVFGVTNSTEECFQSFTDGSICSNPERYWFWDSHPTTRAHKILASLFILDLLRSGAIRPAQLVR